MPVIPKTDEEAEKIKMRGEKTKEMLFNDLKLTIAKAKESFPNDDFLEELKLYLEARSFKHFNPKSKLVQLVLEVDEHIDSLSYQSSMNMIVDDSDCDSDEEI